MSDGAFITHQPVINKQRAVTANRLLVHAHGMAPGQLAALTLKALGPVWPTERTVFVGLANVMPDPGLLDWTVPPNAIVEIPAAALNLAPTLQLVQALQQAGVTLCLDGYLPPRALPQSVAFRFVLAQATAAPAGAAPGVMLARDLADAAAFDDALKNRYEGAAGWFFLSSSVSARKLSPAHAQIVRLLNLVRKNADMREIEAALKHDVALSFKLLRYINSAGFGLSCEIESFRHAITILGYDKLHKWLSLLLVTSSKAGAATALMQAAIVRGRFMELIGARFFGKNEIDNLFITGAFSLLDALLGSTMEAILQEMSLPESVADALLRRDSVYKPFLELALATESDSDAAVSRIAASLQLTAEHVNQAQLQALSFADSPQFG
jgi:EAL and modified HD-GYP domain-containing signal transduction protein